MKKKWVYLLLVVLSTALMVACASTTPAVSNNLSSDSTSSSALDSANITKINLNTASSDEFLAAIPGLGNRMMREFEEYRPYISILLYFVWVAMSGEWTIPLGPVAKIVEGAMIMILLREP